MVFGPNDATLGLSKRHCPWSGVAGVAVVPIMSELIESHAIFNVFLCYTLLHTHCHGRLERKTLAGPMKAILLDSGEPQPLASFRLALHGPSAMTVEFADVAYGPMQGCVKLKKGATQNAAREDHSGTMVDDISLAHQRLYFE
jgi:hypothetical protein